MDHGVSSLISGMITAQRRMDVVTNNLANVSTVGFKRQECVSGEFSMLLYNARNSNSPAARLALANASRLENQGQNLNVITAVTILEDGPRRYTGNSLDLALEGNGFFCLETPEGIMYTRDGQFQLDAEGYVVSTQGYKLLSDGGPIQFQGGEDKNKPTELKVDEQGNIFDGSQNIGTLKIARVDDPLRLVRKGHSLFSTADGSELPLAEEGYRVHQGCLELSNVSAIAEMARMIEVHRTFETYQKLLQEYDGLRGRLIDQVTRT